MTDPLLTIEDATREYRVSPKTIRRRLTSGEIDGAYKRPGNRGPEWVMPRRALEAAGFVPRPVDAPASLPSGPEERASYWERRAVDAEAALRSAHRPPARRRGRRGLGWALVGVSLLIALVAGIVVMTGDGGPEADPVASGAMPLVIELLERETAPGEAIGFVGERRPDALPADRVAAPSPRAGWTSSAGPRFVVATFDEAATPGPVRALRDSAEVLLRAPHAGMVVEVYDRRSPTTDETLVGPVTSGAAPSPSTTDGEAAPPTPAPEAPVATDGGPIEAADRSDEPASSTAAGLPGPPEAPSRQAQVAAGESFWSIAEDVVATELGVDGSDAAVTAYWSVLMSANADRLVEPGNPDVLHVGQTLVVPPLT